MSYGLTVKLLEDVLPLDEPLHAVTIRNHVLTVAQRLEDALGEEQWSFIDSCQVFAPRSGVIIRAEKPAKRTPAKR
jgi:hypothetical protein